MTSQSPQSPPALTSSPLPQGSAGPVEAGDLRPFFAFYGGKWRDALKHYPKPEHRRIVEPFAGSAGYAVRYAEADVILCDRDPVIVAVWQFLIGASRRDILAIPDVPLDGSVDDLKVCQEARWLVGFWLNRAASSPRRSPSKWMRDGIRPGSFWGQRVRETIARQVDRIRHWKALNVDYRDCPVSGEATWFIDPPYALAGSHYRHGAGDIDFGDLTEWCRERRGLAIVCENAGADWLPFETLADVKTTRRGQRSHEVVWVNRRPDCSAVG